MPPEWVSGDTNALNVREDLGIRCPVSNLTIYRGPRRKATGKPRSKKLYCRWLPPESEDHRPNQGRNASGKRVPLEGTTGKEDPYAAGRIAVQWYEEKRKYLTELAKENEYNSNYSLEHYWQIYFEDFQRDFQDKVGGRKRITNERNTWNADVTGIGCQPFARKSIDKIVQADLVDYWHVLDKKGQVIDSSMAGKKKEVKTLINKLFNIARESRDFPKILTPTYPIIRKGSKKEAVYLDKDEWQMLLKKIIELSGGYANQFLSQEMFLNVEWDEKDRRNKRNFIELYDAVLMMWFFHLRSQDMPVLKCEMFEVKVDDDGNEEAYLKMHQAKGNRDLKTSEAYRPDAVNAVKRMLQRRKSRGWLFFDMYSRPTNNPSQSQVGDTLNTLLQYACVQAGITKKVIWTSLRHTAFMETLREYPELNEESELIRFADNAYTSAAILRQEYLNKLKRSSSAKEARKKIKKGVWTFSKPKLGELSTSDTEA